MNTLIFTRKTFLIILIFFIKISLFAQAPGLDSLENLLKTAQGNQKFEILLTISKKYIQTAPNKVIEYSKTAIALTDSLKNDSIRALLYSNLGLSYYFTGEYLYALECFTNSLDLYQKLKDDSGIARTKTRIAGIYLQTGEYDKSIQFIQEAIRYFEKTENNENLIKAYNIAGSSLLSVQNNNKALEYYEKAYSLSIRLNNKRNMFFTLKNIGNIHFMSGDYELAEENYIEVLKLAREMDNQNYIAGSLFNIGNIYWIKEDYQTSFKYHSECLDIYRAIDNKGFVARSLNNTGGLLALMKKYDLAEKHLNEGLAISKEVGAKHMIQGIYQAFFDMYNEKGNYKKALEYNILYNNQKDSVYNENIGKKIVELQEQYEAEKREKKIEVLKKEKEIETLNSERQERYKLIIILFSVLLAIVAFLIFNRFKLKQKHVRNELEKKNLEVEKRLLRSQMNPHFIFNSLNSIQNYIIKNNLKLAESFLMKFAKLMRYNLENSREPMITLEDDINTLQLNLELEKLRFKDKFDFKITVAPEIDIENTYIPPMLVQPFIENAIKHGMSNKSGKGNISIDYKISNELIKCVVTDDGIGREKAGELTKDISKHKSLGVQLTEERLEILNKQGKSNITFKITDLRDDTGIACGTKVELNIPFETDE